MEDGSRRHRHCGRHRDFDMLTRRRSWKLVSAHPHPRRASPCADSENGRLSYAAWETMAASCRQSNGGRQLGHRRTQESASDEAAAVL
jgi:hypothetical protein